MHRASSTSRLEALSAAGVRTVAAVDLTRPEIGLPIFRVVAAGLEGAERRAGLCPGHRACRAAAAMSCYVFLGPTLPAAEAASLLDAVYLPPVRQGDLLRLVREQRPSMVGIVDGYFRDVPACWHKEILFALANGVHVFGAASMGALRAAELDGFGMVGIGSVYAAYRLGRFEPYRQEPFEDDDEVAIVHGPAETGFVNLSEAMVNIRATLARAAEDGIIDEDGRDRLVPRSRPLHYPDRNLTALSAAGGDGRPERGCTGPTGRVAAHRARRRQGERCQSDADCNRGARPRAAHHSSRTFALRKRPLGELRLPMRYRRPAQGPSQLHVLDEARLGPETDLLRRAVERRAALLRADAVGFIPNRRHDGGL